MNPIEQGVGINGEPLAKILRKRRARRSIAGSGLRSIYDSRAEHPFYTVGRSSLGSGSQWLASKSPYVFELPMVHQQKSFVANAEVRWCLLYNNHILISSLPIKMI